MNCCRIMCMFDKQTYVSSRSYFSFLCYLKQQFVSLSPRWMLSLLCQIQNDEFLIKVNSLKKERREEGLKGGAQYVWNTNVHFQRFFFFLGQMNGRAFWNETAQQDQETCQIFFSFCFFFLIKATSKLALKTTLWSNPHHSCKEFPFYQVQSLIFLFTLLFKRVFFTHAPMFARMHACVSHCVCLCAQRLGEALSIWKVSNKKINSYLQTPVPMHTPWKMMCLCMCVCMKQNTQLSSHRDRRPTNESE